MSKKDRGGVSHVARVDAFGGRRDDPSREMMDAAPLPLSAFADEISPDLDEQVRVCRRCGISQVELRGVNGLNVMDFPGELRSEIRQTLADAGIGVISIASPIGKVPIDAPFGPHFERFKQAVELAHYFSAPYIRLFSYYPPAAGGSVLAYRDEVLQRTRAKVDYVAGEAIVLLHENETKIYGEKGRECLDLLRSVDSPKFRAAFDFANFIQADDHPETNWPMLKPYVAHIHVKDALLGSGKVVPAGRGAGHIAEILTDGYASGYRGYLSLEPHLAAHEQFSGFSGPSLFEAGVEALRELCEKAGIPLAGRGE